MGKLQSQTPMSMFWLGLFKGTSNFQPLLVYSLVGWGKCHDSVIMVEMFCKWYCCKDITASALNFRCYNFIILCMRDFHNVAITIKFISKISVLTYVWFTYLVILVALQQYLYLLKTMTDLDTRIRSAFTLRLTNYLEEYMSAKNRW